MMLWETLSAARDLGRLHDIASILIRYGFGDMVRRLGMAAALERAGNVLRWKEASELARLEPPARVRRAMEEMGPTFVKLGQILATRIDLFAPEWIAEFEKLQDQVPTVPFAEIRQQLEQDLGSALDESFHSLNPEPIAAGSIAQVYQAQLPNGDQVVIKVRRPGIRPVIEADLRLLDRLARIFESELPELRRFQPRKVVQQFTQSLHRELDLAAECRNAERIAHNFQNHPEIIVPKVYWQWSGERVNVQQAIDGIPGRNLDAVDKAGLERKVLAQNGARAVLKMILEDGFFHADPHPGNVFYLTENRIAFIDFGMVGQLSEQRRYQLIELLQGVVSKEATQVIDVLLDWADDTLLDTQGLTLEIDTFINQFHGVPISKLNFNAILTDFTALLRDHQLILPADLALLTKALISLDGMGRELDPAFDIITETQPFLQRAILARYSPQALARRGWRTLSSTLGMLSELPQDLRQLLRSIRNGKLNISVEHLEHLGDQIDRASSRMAMSSVIAALIIGSSIVMTVEGGPTIFGLPFFGLLGFVGAVIGGIWLLFSIWRGGR